MNACDLTEEQFSELMRLCRLYHREARRCKEAKSYVAGCIMIGALLEANLIGMCHLYPDEIPESLLPKKKKEPKPLLEWTLAELLRIARDCGWLPAGLPLGDKWNRRKAKIGDYAIVLKEYRNLVHPGAYMTVLPKSRITKRRLEFCFEIFEVASDHLQERIHASLRKHLEEEEHKSNEAV